MSQASLKKRLAENLQTSKSDVKKERKTKMDDITDIATVDSNYIALKSDALGIIAENLKNQQLSYALFDTIKSPAGGVTSFAVPGISGDEMAKELVGIIIDYKTPRARWDTSDPVEGTPPICFSSDSIISSEGKPCNQCEYNEFGSKDNGNSNGKQCKESVTVFLLRPNNILPIIVRVPVSSKISFLKYMTRLVSNATPLSSVVTRITLEKVTNKGGQPYAAYKFEAAGQLSQQEASTARAFGQKFTEMLDIENVDADITDVA
jgi:hypothetical protein